MDVLVSVLLGAVAGWLAGLIMKSKSTRVVINIILGIVGGFVGGWLFKTLGIDSISGWTGSIVTSTLGAIILIYLGRTIFKKK